MCDRIDGERPITHTAKKLPKRVWANGTKFWTNKQLKISGFLFALDKKARFVSWRRCFGSNKAQFFLCWGHFWLEMS